MTIQIPILGDGRWFPLTRQLARRMEEEFYHVAFVIGQAVLHARDLVVYSLQRKIKIRHVLEQSAFVGVDTLGIALIMTMMCGMVIALQLAKEMVKQGAGNYVGALVSMAILRELAPVMTGFSVIAMAGSAFAAELSTMRITNQVDALRVLHVHPVRYLVLPRVYAGTLMLPLMTILTATAGILGGMLVSNWIAEVPFSQYLESVWQNTAPKDCYAALLKSGVFGFLIALLCTTIGISTTGGAKEVGEATTRSVVWSFVAMAVFDYILTYFIYGTA